MNSWLKIFIFYRASHFNQFIANCLMPSIEEMKKDGITSFTLFFSRHRGDHLKLYVLCQPQSIEEQWSELNTRFSQFMLENPSPNPMIIYPLKHSAFMDFSNNSIFRNLFELQGQATYGKGEGKIRESISAAMMQVFSNEKVEDEIIYTFLVYLQLGMLNAVYPTLQDAEAEHEKFLSYLRASLTEHDSLLAEESFSNPFAVYFKENTSLLIEIVDDIWIKDEQSIGIPWLSSWKCDCRDFFSQSTNKFEAMQYLAMMSFEHTGQVGFHPLVFTMKLITGVFQPKLETNRQTND